MNIVQPQIPLSPEIFSHRSLWEPFNKALVARLTLDPRSIQMEQELMRVYTGEYMFHYYVCAALNFVHPLQHGDLSSATAALELATLLFQDDEWAERAKLDAKFVLAKCYLWHGLPLSALLRLSELRNEGYRHDEFNELFMDAHLAARELVKQ